MYRRFYMPGGSYARRPPHHPAISHLLHPRRPEVCNMFAGLFYSLPRRCCMCVCYVCGRGDVSCVFVCSSLYFRLSAYLFAFRVVCLCCCAFGCLCLTSTPKHTTYKTNIQTFMGLHTCFLFWPHTVGRRANKSTCGHTKKHLRSHTHTPAAKTRLRPNEKCLRPHTHTPAANQKRLRPNEKCLRPEKQYFFLLSVGGECGKGGADGKDAGEADRGSGEG